MFVILALCVIVTVGNSDCAVLDPALYLSPSPPVKTSDAGSLWSSPANLRGINTDSDNGETLSKSRTFWPKIQTDYRLGGIHIPLTFSLSGFYGSQVTDGVSAVGTSYADISGITRTKIIQRNSKPIVGSQYDVYNSGPSVVRIYGGSNKAAWSGWGNGKWGHYGKG